MSGHIIDTQDWPVRRGGIRVDYAGAPLLQTILSAYNEANRRAKAADGNYLVARKSVSIIQKPDLWQKHGRSRRGWHLFARVMSTDKQQQWPRKIVYRLANTIVGNKFPEP